MVCLFLGGGWKCGIQGKIVIMVVDHSWLSMSLAVFFQLCANRTQFFRVSHSCEDGGRLFPTGGLGDSPIFLFENFVAPKSPLQPRSKMHPREKFGDFEPENTEIFADGAFISSLGKTT